MYRIDEFSIGKGWMPTDTARSNDVLWMVDEAKKLAEGHGHPTRVVDVDGTRWSFNVGWICRNESEAMDELAHEHKTYCDTATKNAVKREADPMDGDWLLYTKVEDYWLITLEHEDDSPAEGPSLMEFVLNFKGRVIVETQREYWTRLDGEGHPSFPIIDAETDAVLGWWYPHIDMVDAK